MLSCWFCCGGRFIRFPLEQRVNCLGLLIGWLFKYWMIPPTLLSRYFIQEMLNINLILQPILGLIMEKIAGYG